MPMEDIIDSGIPLRHLLGGHLARIGSFDPLKRERNLTRRYRQRLIRQYGSICGYCGHRGTVDAAHIVPLEVGSKTNSTNLILLCKHCHHLYDNGHCSISRMSEVAVDWGCRRFSGSSRRPLRPMRTPTPTISTPPPAVRQVFDEVLRCQRERKFVKAIKLIDALRPDIAIPESARVYCRIKRAELTRRRAAHGVADQSLRELEGINRTTVPTSYLPAYDYELGYVHRLVGNHKEAAAIFGRSAKEMLLAAGRRPPGIDYVAASVNALCAELASRPALSSRDISAWHKHLARLNSLASRHGAYWGGRWALNCAALEVHLHIKNNDAHASWSALARLRELYFDWDVARGWDKGALQTIAGLEGLVRVMFSRTADDLQAGLGLLARAFLTRVGPRQRLEGIRDVGFALAMGLRRIGQPRVSMTADAVEALMRKTRDGTSVLWPYVAFPNGAVA